MATKSEYDRIYSLVKNLYNSDQSIIDQTFNYIKQHPDELFCIVGLRKWSIGHQLIYHGALKVFKDILKLYNENNPIDIFSKTKDSTPQTILDIARDRRSYFKDQYEYIEHLFVQDQFIRACIANNWSVIDNMLAKDPRLLNEKPPYYSNYFVHYLILNGDARTLASYNSSDNPLQLDLKNAAGKTPLDLAYEERNQELIDEITQLLRQTRSSTKNVPVERDYRDEDRRTPSPTPPPPPPPRRAAGRTDTAPARLPPETLKKITCRLTEQVFVDPVRASDGHTYERTAIVEYFQNNRYSPATGESMNDTFSTDNQMIIFIRDLRRKNLI